MSAIPLPNRSRLAESVTIGALFALLVLLLYADPLFFRRNFAGRDLTVYNLPMEKAVHDAYARGRLPVWMPEISGGRPLLPNPNAGAMYPVRPLLSVLPFPMAMRLFPILHWIAAGIGMIALTRTLGASPAGAWIAATTYVFSGVGVAQVFFPNLHPGMALLPWILWGIARPASGGRKTVLLSLLFALAFLAGDVFTVGMAIAASILWIAVERGRESRRSELLVLTASLALASLLAAPQIVATALWLPETNRAVRGMKLYESFFFSVNPLRLLELVVPFLFGANWQLDNGRIWGWPVFRYRGMGMFTSLYAGAFALIAILSSRKERSAGFRFNRVLLLLSLAGTVIPSLVPRGWEKFSSPLALRNPEKFSVALMLALALSAGLFFERVNSAGPRRWPLAGALALTLLAVASTLFPQAAGRLAAAVVGDARFGRRASAELAGAITEGAVLWTATVVALDWIRSGARSRTGAALALLTLVPIAANRKIARTLTELELFSPSRFIRLLERSDPAGSYRTLGESIYFPPSQVERQYRSPDGVYTDAERRSWVQHAQALWNRGTVFNNDFDVGDFARMQSLRRLSVAAASFEDSQAFFGSFALRWGLRYRDQKPIAGYRRFGGDFLQDWDVLETAAPDIRVVTGWREETSALEAIAALPHLREGEIVLETGRRARGRTAPGIVHVLAREPGRLSIETVTDGPAWLFVLRGFWTHRTIELDGRPVEAVPAQLAFSAVGLPAGRHGIEWRERVPGGRISRWAPVLWMLFAAAIVARSRKEKQ